MNPDLEHLVVLQAQDLELARLRGELAEAPQRVKVAEKLGATTEKALMLCREQLVSEEKLRRRQELDIAEHRAKLVRLRRSLDTAISGQQVTAFEHEISFAENAIRTLEDDELASMVRTERFEAEEQRAVLAADGAKAAVALERERAAGVQTRNAEAVAGIEHERAALRKEVDERWLSSYDRLAKTRGTAVAEAIGNATSGKCAACQMGVRPQRWQDLIGRDHLDEIFGCESCGRLLFWDPRRDTPKPWTAGERLQAAAGTSGGGSR